MNTQQEKWDHVEEYFECLVECDLNDKECVSECVQALKDTPE